MRTTDPLGRWGPYERQRRQARNSGVIAAVLVLSVLAAAVYWLAFHSWAFFGSQLLAR